MNVSYAQQRMPNISSNPSTSFNPIQHIPVIPRNSVAHHTAVIIGDVIVGHNVFIAPNAVIRADEGSPMYIGNNSDIQDGVVIHGLKNKPGEQYSVVIGENVSLAHQCMVHGPSYIDKNTFVGFQAAVISSNIGKNCVIETGAKVIKVNIPDNTYVPTNAVVETPEQAAALPKITDDYAYKKLNEEVVKVNNALASGYRSLYNNYTQQAQPQQPPPPMGYYMPYKLNIQFKGNTGS